jgi:phosphoglycolate phosphatase-like HAD superfamily hydrolase
LLSEYRSSSENRNKGKENNVAELKVGDSSFDIDVVVFDKDGTLIDFHLMWGSRAEEAVDALIEEAGGGSALEAALYQTLGYQPETQVTAGSGPLAVVPLHKTDVIVSTVLFQHGWLWHEAEQLIADVFSPVMSSKPSIDSVRPLGAVRETIETLNSNGVRTAIATADERDLTRTTLDMLDIHGHFELLYCGDDDDLPQKPSPRLLEDIAERCQVDIARIMMVGDTVGDLSMAYEAKAGARIGVRGGATDDRTLAEWSDVVISSIDEITVL